MKKYISPQVPVHPTQVKVGTVIQDKMDKTILVEVNSFRRHPLYRHVIRTTKRYLVHDEHNTAHVGDQVRFCYCRPISRHKTWILTEVIRQSAQRLAAEHAAEATEPTQEGVTQ
ncbi:MAG: 30S ribosomal protein S17 [Chloroflexi bacterium]|nr:30S ribosomal protein S17 [Chloroflexota bacterium]